jgi:putative transposase
LRFTDSQRLAVLKQAEAGTAVPDLCRERGISSATFYKWRSKFGGIDVLLMARMKELEEENRRLKKLYIEAQIKLILLRRLSQKTLRLSRRREVARWAVEEKGLSTRLACEAFGLSESGYRYQPKLNAENAKISE